MSPISLSARAVSPQPCSAVIITALCLLPYCPLCAATRCSDERHSWTVLIDFPPASGVNLARECTRARIPLGSHCEARASSLRRILLKTYTFTSHIVRALGEIFLKKDASACNPTRKKKNRIQYRIRSARPDLCVWVSRTVFFFSFRVVSSSFGINEL